MNIRIISRIAAAVAVLVSFSLVTSCLSKEEKDIDKVDNKAAIPGKGWRSLLLADS